MARELTEKQQKFLSVLFDEAGGDVAIAKKLAGYAPTYNTREVVNSLKDEILDATQSYMASNAPKAAAEIPLPKDETTPPVTNIYLELLINHLDYR